MIFFITLIFCFINLIHLHEGLDDFDIQSNDVKDSFEDYKTEFYGKDEIYSDEPGKTTHLNQFKTHFYA